MVVVHCMKGGTYILDKLDSAVSKLRYMLLSHSVPSEITGPYTSHSLLDETELEDLSFILRDFWLQMIHLMAWPSMIDGILIPFCLLKVIPDAPLHSIIYQTPDSLQPIVLMSTFGWYYLPVSLHHIIPYAHSWLKTQFLLPLKFIFIHSALVWQQNKNMFHFISLGYEHILPLLFHSSIHPFQRNTPPSHPLQNFPAPLEIRPSIFLNSPALSHVNLFTHIDDSMLACHAGLLPHSVRKHDYCIIPILQTEIISTWIMKTELHAMSYS